jgi:photosystem II stability/assembly factor-like uncharacterized protein
MQRRDFIAACAALGCGAAAAKGDTADTPATASSLAGKRLITGLARAGEQALVAVGQRGHVLRSTDGGLNWTQAQVPVSSDLAAVQFVDARVGHAVGHDGVVLRSEDGGAHWTRVLDGRTANQLVLDHMQRKVAAGGSAEDRQLLDEAQRNLELGPDKPLLDLWFSSANEGFVIGAYNLIFRTTDGGKSWLPWFDRIDNPKLLNLYAIRPALGTLVIAGEAGLLLKLDAAAQRFQALPSDYKGSFFGVLGTPAGALAFGMRGNVQLNPGSGWQPLRSGLAASITAGDVDGDRVLLVDQAGGVVLSRDGGRQFARIDIGAPMPLAAAVLAADAAVLGGPRGLRRVELPKDKS